MSDFDKNHLILILESIRKIENYTANILIAQDLLSDQKSFDASLMNFVIIAECVGRISSNFKNNHQEIEWKKIYAFRNLIAHDYFGIDEDEVWDILKFHLPVLKKQISSLIENI